MSLEFQSLNARPIHELPSLIQNSDFTRLSIMLQILKLDFLLLLKTQYIFFLHKNQDKHPSLMSFKIAD